MNIDKKKKKPAVVTFFIAPVINMIRTYKGIVEHTYAIACYIVPQIATSLVCASVCFILCLEVILPVCLGYIEVHIKLL